MGITLFNSIGFPAVTIPTGLTKDNMPIGVQIIGPPFAEGKILSVAYNYEYKNRKRINFNPQACGKIIKTMKWFNTTSKTKEIL